MAGRSLPRDVLKDVAVAGVNKMSPDEQHARRSDALMCGSGNDGHF
jgi:hypothetical protein